VAALVHAASRRSIEEMMHKGQTVLVKVSKESLGTKGARITSFISLPAFISSNMRRPPHGVSRRSVTERERAAPRRAALSTCRRWLHRAHNAGGQSGPSSRPSRGSLTRCGRRSGPVRAGGAPAALHEEGDLTFRVVPTLFSPEIDEFVWTAGGLRQCAGYVGGCARAGRRVGSTSRPIFDAVGSRKRSRGRSGGASGQSGGYIVIDHTRRSSRSTDTGK